MAQRFWTLKVSIFKSEIPSYHSHWYGSLWVDDDIDGPVSCRLGYVLTEEQAARFNVQDDWTSYAAGDTSERFWTRDEVLAYALEEFDKRAREGDVLVLHEVIAKKGAT